MQYDAGQRRLLSLRDKIRDLRAEMRAVTAAIEPQPVSDHMFGTLKGSTTLSALFDGRDDLIVIHNMGSKCAYCTMWADGYNGLYPHLKQRAAFVVAKPRHAANPGEARRQSRVAVSHGLRQGGRLCRQDGLRHRGGPVPARHLHLSAKGRAHRPRQ